MHVQLADRAANVIKIDKKKNKMPNLENGNIKKLQEEMSKLSVDTNKECLVYPGIRRRSRAVETSERRVLVIYTGGTIGMVKTEDGE